MTAEVAAPMPMTLDQETGEIKPLVQQRTSLVDFAADIKETRARIQAIQQVMRGEMKEGVHYGTIPGTDKPSLLKAGAEMIATMFRIAQKPQIEDLSGEDYVAYRITMVGVHQPTGTVVGYGVGHCSSLEKKYKWRKTWNKKEFEATAADRRQIVHGYSKEKQREFEEMQVRTESADLANTILKMAAKRARVDLILTCTGASDIFAQDLEDMDDATRAAVTDAEREGKPKPKEPQKKAAAPAANGHAEQQREGPSNEHNAPASDGMKALIERKVGSTDGSITMAQLQTEVGYADWSKLTLFEGNECLRFLRAPSEFKRG
jgi:hypothetical protein